MKRKYPHRRDYNEYLILTEYGAIGITATAKDKIYLNACSGNRYIQIRGIQYTFSASFLISPSGARVEINSWHMRKKDWNNYKTSYPSDAAQSALTSILPALIEQWVADNKDELEEAERINQWNKLVELEETYFKKQAEADEAKKELTKAEQGLKD